MSVLSIFTVGVGVGTGAWVASSSTAGEGRGGIESLSDPQDARKEKLKTERTTIFRIEREDMKYSL
jgi:hypothetical protein